MHYIASNCSCLQKLLNINSDQGHLINNGQPTPDIILPTTITTDLPSPINQSSYSNNNILNNLTTETSEGGESVCEKIFKIYPHFVLRLCCFCLIKKRNNVIGIKGDGYAGDNEFNNNSPSNCFKEKYSDQDGLQQINRIIYPDTILPDFE